jgi:hypothetical protein
MIGEHLMGNFMSFDRYGEMNANDASLCKEIIKAKALRLPHLETKLIPEAISLVQGLMTNKPEDRYITFHNYLFFFCLECELN